MFLSLKKPYLLGVLGNFGCFSSVILLNLSFYYFKILNMSVRNPLKIVIICLFTALAFSFQSCKTGEGCQLEDKYQAKTDKDGNLSMKKGKSGLWSKKQKKKMRK